MAMFRTSSGKNANGVGYFYRKLNKVSFFSNLSSYSENPSTRLGSFIISYLRGIRFAIAPIQSCCKYQYFKEQNQFTT
ncbi:MAG TPA: hypothetical protein PKC06_17105 [Saprospiraceae bacterium]|nr:hypothetical protein [Saprospiraceae bacterium]